MKVLVAPDAFKGSLSAGQAAQAMALGVRRICPAAEIAMFPMADGGEGTLDAVLACLSGKRAVAPVVNAAGQPHTAEFGMLDDGTAVIEVARVVGLTMAGVAAVPVAQRTTAGVGLLLKYCLDRGVRRFMVGLGGSATNDGGMGLLQALGVRVAFATDAPVAVDVSGLDPRVRDCHIDILSDVDNPLCGPQGATCVFGPQKGVLPEQVAVLDAWLQRFAGLLDPSLALRPASGAAGGLGYALQWLGGAHRSGAEVLLALYHFDAALQDADLVLTGEGRSDLQTLSGKVPWAVARHAAQAGVPAVLVSGAIAEDARAQLKRQFRVCHALADDAIDPEPVMRDAAELLAQCVASVATMFDVVQRVS